MNEPTRHDPELQSFEARLGAAPLRLPVAEQQQLLYQCAFAAGKKSSIRTLRCWQGAAVGMLILLGAINVPPPRGQGVAATQHVQPAIPTRQDPAPRVKATSTLVMKDTLLGHQTPTPPAVDLDAWQLPHPNSDSLTEELAQLEKSDPRLRFMTVGVMTSALLNP